MALGATACTTASTASRSAPSGIVASVVMADSSTFVVSTVVQWSSGGGGGTGGAGGGAHGKRTHMYELAHSSVRESMPTLRASRSTSGLGLGRLYSVMSK